jgi:hypothetical protein
VHNGGIARGGNALPLFIVIASALGGAMLRRYPPEPSQKPTSFDDLVRPYQHIRWNRQAEGRRCL